MNGSNRISGAGIAYGLDLSGDRLTMVKASAGRGGIQCETVYGRGAESAARKAAERGRAVLVGAMPARDSVSRWLTAPLSSVFKARQVFPALLDIDLPFPLEKAVCVYPVVEKTGEGSVRALSIAAREQAVDNRLEAFQAAGWDPILLEHEGAAIWDRALDESPSGAKVRIVAHLGHERSVLVLGRELEFVSAHGSPIGFGAEVPESKLDAFTGKARRLLMSEIQAGNLREVEWVWTGPGATNRKRVKALEANLKVNVRVAFEIAEDPESFLARALAVRGLRKPRTPADFRVGSRRHARMIQLAAARQRGHAALFAAAALFFIAVQIGWLSLLTGRDTQLQKALSEKAQALAPGSRIQLGQEVQTVRGAPEQQQSLQDPFLRAFRPKQEALLVGILERAQNQLLDLEFCELDKGAIVIRGTAPGREAYQPLFAYLQEQGFTTSDQSRSGASPGGRVSFNLRGVRSDGG